MFSGNQNQIYLSKLKVLPFILNVLFKYSVIYLMVIKINITLNDLTIGLMCLTIIRIWIQNESFNYKYLFPINYLIFLKMRKNYMYEETVSDTLFHLRY